MCDASDFAVGAVLGQRVDKKLNVIHYDRKTLDNSQKNYASTEKEFLAVVFACDKFRQYIIDSIVIIHTDHDAIIILWRRNMSNQGLSDGYFFRNLICTLLIGREQTIPWRTTFPGLKIYRMILFQSMIVFLMSR